MQVRKTEPQEVSGMQDRRQSRDQQCPPCEAFVGEAKPETCAFFQDYLTDEEQEVLETLRQLKSRARTLRGKIRGIEQALKMADTGDQGKSAEGRKRKRAPQALYRELEKCRGQLDELRETWKEWEARRENAHHRKMVLLGHRPGEST
jgi:hypothetical protein